VLTTLTAETNRQLRVYEMGCLRRIMGVTRRDHILNSSWKTIGLLQKKIQTSRLRYFDHLTRIDKCRLP